MKALRICQTEPQWIKDSRPLDVPAICNQPLDAGDIDVITDTDDRLLIERKSPSDLLASIKDGRLINQVARMRETVDRCYVVITGPLLATQDGKTSIYRNGWNDTNWTYSSIQGCLLSVQEMGAGVIHCAGDADFWPCILRLDRRSREAIPVLPARQVHLFNAGETVLASLPGIGTKRATELMQHFPNAATAIWYLTDLAWPGESITGIGLETKKKIIKTLGNGLTLNIVEENSNGN